MRRCGLLGFALALAWLAAACGGGGGSSTPTTPAPPPAPPDPVSFTASGTPGSTTVHLTKAAGTSSDVLRLEIRASEFADLYGLGFDLVYPADLLDFRGGSQTEGGFLSADGSRTEIFARQVTDGMILVGLSRIGEVGGVEGSGLLLTLDFTVVASGTGSFSYEANEAFDSSRERLDEAVWQGGSLRVTL